ncbi:MAG: preprotein translocase subunit SecA [Clostridia bacterium]
MGIFSKLFKSSNEREIEKLAKIADQVEAIANNYSSLSDDELKACTVKFKERLTNGETLNDILPEAFAVVREASGRVLGMRHFYVQLLGGIVLHQGRIAEMMTGEGKTLVATLPAYLNALDGKGVHIVTVNDYLAQRDAEWMGKIFKFLGLSVGIIVTGMDNEQKKVAYNCDICYATNNELGFDYLRDNMVVHKEEKVQRPLNFAIIDEVDSILIDEARTPLIISGMSGKSSNLYVEANRFAKKLTEEDYILEEKENTVRLSDEGVDKAEKFFRIENLGDAENQDLIHYINNALKAHYIMKLNSNYIVVDGEIIIVDEFTGRQMIGRRYSDGLHQAIEAKENVRIQNESQTLATITFQNYFRIYKKLSGMTGTAKTEENEFKDIYSIDVVVLPTNMPLARIDENDVLFPSIKGKTEAILKDVELAYQKGQPILVGTITVDKSEELSSLLTKHKIKHNVLNAKNHAKEAEIVAQAGKKGTVTIATNMAGRGTDIMLGGNPEFMAKQKLLNLGYSNEVIGMATSFAKIDDELVQKAHDEYTHYYNLFKVDTDAEKQEVIALGGLRILGTERHDSRRIDNQLRGRAGRQGDPGSSIFYLSMEDDMIRVFGGDNMKAVAERFNLDDSTPIDIKILTKMIQSAQAKVENRNFSARKYILSFDDVLNNQREIIYRERNAVLDGVDVHEQILKWISAVSDDVLDVYCSTKTEYIDWDYDEINTALEKKVLLNGTNFVTVKVVEDDLSLSALKNKVYNLAVEQYEKKIADMKESGIDFSEIERVIMLKNVDKKWIDHIDDMQKLKEGIGLRSIGQQDPIVAYRREGFDMFEEMIETIQKDTVTILCKAEFNAEVKREEQAKEVSTNTQKTQTQTRTDKKIGRNDPCPCGSGRKYKNCCGKNA